MTHGIHELEKLAHELKAQTLHSQTHHHHAVENRKKYPADYDSSSDYEVKKLGDLVHQLDDLKKQTQFHGQ